MREPRDPLLKVVSNFDDTKVAVHSLIWGLCERLQDSRWNGGPSAVNVHGGFVKVGQGRAPAARPLRAGAGRTGTRQRYVNDPSAGSPTETLLRLLLPLNDQV